MPPAKSRLGRKVKSKQAVRPHSYPSGSSSKAGSSKRSRESPGATAAKPSPSMPPPPPHKKAAPDTDDDWTMPSLSDDPVKACRKLEKMLREVETLEAQNGTEHQGRTRVLNHEERKKVAHKQSIEDFLKRLNAAETISGRATPTGLREQQPASDASMGSGSSHHTTRSSAKPSPTGAAATASSPSEPNPNLCHAATAAMAAFYTSPVTGPQLERSQPPVTRGGEAAAQADLRQRMANVKPKGRVQRTVQLSEAEQRAWNAEQARRRRAQAKVREVIFTKFMRDLALELGQLPLVQLLMAEFALQPCNVGTTGQMRFRFLALYAQTCHTVHADAAEGVAGLPALAWVLRTHKPARELLTKKLHAAKALGAQWSSGGHKLGKIIAMPEQTLMQMRIEIFELQQKPGRIAGELSGNSEECELIVQSMANGKSYTFEFRRALHIHRHFSCNGSVLSYANTTQSAISGALIFLKNYLKDDLPPVMSRSTMTRHDQRFDWVQRLLGCRELQEAFSPLSALWDDASQRGVSFLGVALLGLRLDDSCYYEVMRIARLKRDLEGTAKTGKNGKNIARQLMFAFQHHMGAAARDMLWQLGVMLIDSTAGNSGPKIITGDGGSAAHLRSMIEAATRGEQGEQGHLLIEMRECASHIPHNECEKAIRSFGECKEGRAFMKTKQTIDEEKGSKKRCWMKTVLDEMTQYVTDQGKPLLAFIEKEEGLKPGSLAFPPGGVKERFGFYGKSARWYNFLSTRVDLIARFALSREPHRVVDELKGVAEEELSLVQRIERIRDAGVREMLAEIANPKKRICLIIFQWYFEQSLERFIDFTQNDVDLYYQAVRMHRVIRCRLEWFDALRRAPAKDGPWAAGLGPLIDKFVKQQGRQIFDGVDARALAQRFFDTVYSDFHTRTRGFWSPLCLPMGLLCEKGHAQCTAKELIDMAGPQGPMDGFPRALAFNPAKAKPDTAEAKGRLHEGVGTTEIINAVLDVRYRGVALYWLDDLWPLVVELKRKPPSAILGADSPLRKFLTPFARAQPWTNGGGKGAESIMKTVKKVLKPQQKMNDETATRNVSAVRRDPIKLYHITSELDLQASHAYGHNSSATRAAKTEAPDVDASDSILGTALEGEVWDDEEYALAASGDDSDSEEDADDEGGADESQPMPTGKAATGKAIRSQLVIGGIVKAQAKEKTWAGWFHAEVRAIPPQDAKGKGSKSSKLRWLDEVGGEGSGVYGYDQSYTTEQEVAFTKITSAEAVLYPDARNTSIADKEKRWRTEEACALTGGMASSSSAVYTTKPLVTETLWADVLAEADEAEAESRADLQEPASEEAKSGAHARPRRSRGSAATASSTAAASASASAASSSTTTATGGSSANPIDVDPEKLVLRKRGGRGKASQQRVSSSCLLSSDPTEWLNDSQVACALALLVLAAEHRIKFTYPRGSNVAAVFGSRLVQRALTDDLSPPLAAIDQEYVDGAHWQKLLICFHEKIVYYHEPYGKPLPENHPIRKEFDATFGALDDEWRFESIEVGLQTDGCSCGVWALVVSRAFVAYADSNEFGKGTFGTFLVAWLAEQQPQPVVDLRSRTLGRSGTQRVAAVEGNLAFIREERTQLRALLLRARREGKLAFQDGAMLHDFVESADAAATSAELDELNEEE